MRSLRRRLAVSCIAASIPLFLAGAAAAQPESLGRLGGNAHAPDSTANRFGVHGSPYSASSIHNPHGRFGNRFSPESPNNPFATRMPISIGE